MIHSLHEEIMNKLLLILIWNLFKECFLRYLVSPAKNLQDLKYLNANLDLFLFSSPCWKSSFSSSVTSSRGFMKAAPLFRGSLATRTNRASVILTHWPSISCSRWSVDSADDLPTHVTWPEIRKKIIIIMIIFGNILKYIYLTFLCHSQV